MRRKALITGGSRGIGKAIADQLRGEEYEVYAPAREELNLMDSRSVEEFISKMKSVAFDIIVNNAGINDINNIENITDSELENAMQINLISPIRLLRGFTPQMKEQNYGKIVNIGSIWGVVSKSGRTVYSVTKHGIHGLTKTLAVELAENNILINTVCPGFTLTELTTKNNTPEQIAGISKEIPMKRMAQPREIADVVCYLVSDRNTYLTGQLIVVDGGYTSR